MEELFSIHKTLLIFTIGKFEDILCIMQTFGIPGDIFLFNNFINNLPLYYTPWSVHAGPSPRAPSTAVEICWRMCLGIRQFSGNT